jgi:hypothetical protein
MCRTYGKPATLKAIRNEAFELMANPPPSSGWGRIDDTRLPPTIAALKPDYVIHDGNEVEITTRAYFDGGWGYYVPKSASPSRELLFRHYSVGHGVYWFYPY